MILTALNLRRYLLNWIRLRLQMHYIPHMILFRRILSPVQILPCRYSCCWLHYYFLFWSIIDFLHSLISWDGICAISPLFLISSSKLIWLNNSYDLSFPYYNALLNLSSFSNANSMSSRLRSQNNFSTLFISPLICLHFHFNQLWYQ